MATQSPHEFLSLTSVKTIVLQIRHVFSAMFISIDGFYDGVSSKKDGLVGLIFLSLGIGVFFTGKLSHLSKLIVYAVLALISLFVTEFRSWFLPVYFVNLTLTLFALVTIWRKEVNRKALFRLLVSLSVLPVLFLILFAIQDGNTFRIITRYAGYGYSFALILVVWLYRWLLENERELKPVIFVAIAVQAVQVVVLISQIYEDRQPRYFMDYAQPREANPYPLIAAKIEEMAAPGDTVVFPSDSYVQNGNEAYYSVIDAQLTNFYLAKDNVVYQRIDPKEQNKVFLKSPDGSVVELFDFQGNKYRY